MDTINIGGKTYNRSRLLVDLRRADEPLSATSSARIQKAFASFKSKAGFGDVDFKSPDLTYLQGIFVTSGMNRNRDVFLPSEMLRSFPTAMMKPINVEHEVEENGSLVQAFSKNTSIPLTTGKNTIIGSIYDAAFVEEGSGKMLLASEFASANVDEMYDLENIDRGFLNPDKKYHIIIAAALWNFMFPKTIADIVEEIENGERALSMESFFLDYDLLADNEVKARKDNPDLDVLYKQKMSYAGQKVGRVLRTILWGGGGLVDNPGNPYGFEYITTSASERNEESPLLASTASLVSTESQEVTVNCGGDGNDENTENPTQGDNSRMDEKTLAKLTDTNQDLVEKNATLNAAKASLEQEKASLATAKAELEKKVADLETAKANLEADIAKKDETIETLTAEKTQASEELETTKATLTEKETALTEATEKVASVEELTQRAEAAEAKVREVEMAQTVASRKDKLEELNLFIDTDTNESLAKLTDEEFEAVVQGRQKVAAAFNSKNNKDGGKATASVPVLEGLSDKKNAMSAVASAGAQPATGTASFDDLVNLMAKV